MSSRIIKEGVYSVGAVDWNERNFHGSTYKTNKGVTYNSYLIKDEKTVLIDLVRKGFERELIDNISQITDPSKIDIVIINHIEPDHSGAFPDIVRLCPNAAFYGTQKAKEGLFKYYGVMPENWQSVKSGSKISIGKRTLDFIDVPMLHWPDSMFTYSAFDKILFSNDAFGQHYCTNQVFDDEADTAILFEEAQKYYANILFPFCSILAVKLQAIAKLNLAIDFIAPSHGLVWKRDISKILEKYTDWAAQKCQNKVVIVYETMWNSTEIMARKILEGITSQGIKAELFDVTKADRTDIISHILDSKGIIIGSSTHDNEMLPVIAGFIQFFKGLKVKGRKSLIFGSYGWAGGAVKEIEEICQKAGGIELFPSISVQFAPNKEELEKCYQAGKTFAQSL
ncbi:MAG: FprA family A-type flavoprotein [Elusimicrobiota bacterium]|jgi:flavorubredoxin|nr:FprA family A-type flavoprotein [Elusimicrobiota bacterium]